VKLGNFIRSAGARPINPHPVLFNAKGRDQNLKLVKAEVRAVFVFVDEDQREELRVRAREAVRKKFADREIPDGVFRDEEEYQLLFEALRDEDVDANGQYPRLADTVDELRSSLVLRECRRLMDEYEQYIAEEFPPAISKDEMAKLVEEAKKNSVSDLLTSYGFEKLVALASFSSGRSGG